MKLLRAEQIWKTPRNIFHNSYEQFKRNEFFLLYYLEILNREKLPTRIDFFKNKVFRKNQLFSKIYSLLKYLCIFENTGLMKNNLPVFKGLRREFYCSKSEKV